jgi:hypothetical protein
MMLTILRLLLLIPTALRLRSELAIENLAIRQQLAVLHRWRRRPKLRKSDRFFWLHLSRSWSRWKEMLVIVKPETVLRWHRRRFASYWTRLSGQKAPGRPGKDREIRELIRKLAKSNPNWGAATLLFHLAPNNASAYIFDSVVPRLEVPKERGILLDPLCHELRCLLPSKRPGDIAQPYLPFKVQAHGNPGFVRSGSCVREAAAPL